MRQSFYLNYFNNDLMQYSIKLKLKKFFHFIFFMVLFFSMHKYANAIEKNFTININKTFDISFTGGWLELGEFALPRASYNDSHYRCSTGSGANLCAHTEFRVNGGTNNPAAYWSGWLKMEPKEVDIGNGKKLTFSAYFKASPSIKWEEINQNNMKNKFHQYPVGIGSMGIGAGSKTDWSSGEQAPSLVCGAIGGCTIHAQTYLDSIGNNLLKLAVKLPGDFQKGTYTFSNVEVLNLGHTARNASNTIKQSASAKVYISGTITVPERCYIDTGSSSEMKFNDVSAGANNGKLEERDFTLRTICKYINLNIKQYIKVSGNNGVSEYEILSKNNTNEKALALVMRIVRGDNGENYYANCTPDLSGRVKFGQEYLLREINGNGLNIHSYRDTIKLALCKYGIPIDYGEKNIPLTIISRWSDT
ncbi:TPA: FasG [Providencia alcalifaciens]|nr:FasG [Providencia alcalifaciens]